MRVVITVRDELEGPDEPQDTPLSRRSRQACGYRQRRLSSSVLSDADARLSD